MAKLSDDEARQFKALQEKQKAPDTPAPSVNYTLDLGNDTAYERAVSLGLVPGAKSGEGEEGEGEEGEGEEGPRRRGYFGGEG